MKRNWNWMLLGGLLLCIAGLLTYFDVFARFPITRDFPWANLLIYAAALTMLGVGLWRAYAQPERYRGKIYGPILSLLGVAVFALFIFYVFFFSYWLPASAGAPRVGDRMANFTLPDQNGEPFTLSQLVPALSEAGAEISAEAAKAEPAAQEDARDRWVLLVFYRGHW